MKLSDDLTRIKDGIRAIAVSGAWTADPAAAWAIADLEKSGITPAGADAARLAYTNNRRRIGDLLNRRSGLPGGCCLVFPYFTATGLPDEYARRKPEKPRTETRDGEDRVVKYDVPSGCPSRLYIPRRSSPTSPIPPSI